jgi:hypothetical protein
MEMRSPKVVAGAVEAALPDATIIGGSKVVDKDREF